MKQRLLISQAVAACIGILAIACSGGSATTTANPTVAAVAPNPPSAPSAAPAPSVAPSPVIPSSAASAVPSASAVTSASPAAASAAFPPPPGGPIKVTGAFAQASTVQGVVYVAVDQGFFSKYGLDVNITQVQGTSQIAALGANEIQFAALGANEVANADVGGASAVMIATCSDFPIFSLYANPKYPTIQDLAGQTIGVTTAGSATDAAAHLFISHYNLQNQVKIVPSGGTIPAILAAVTQGVIAAGVVSPPTTQQAADQGLVELVNGATLGVPMNHSGLAVTRSYLQDNRDTVMRLLTAYQEAWTWTADPANRDAVVTILAKYTQTNAQLASVGYDAMVPIWTGTPKPSVNPQAVANLLALSDNPAVQTADPNQFFDNSLINAVPVP